MSTFVPVSALSNSTPPGAGAALCRAASRPVRLYTLGCKVNQYETQWVRETLLANGYRDAKRDEPAALAVVNTCTVTAQSDSKSRGLIRQIARHNPGVKIVVMGCYATREPAALRRLPGVAAVIEDKRELPTYLRSFGVRQVVRTIRRFDDHARAFVKVQDGCALHCSYCIIPKVRPGLASRPAAELAEEVGGLVEAGYREIVLTGIHLGHYGIDLSRGQPRRAWQRLPHLLHRLLALPGAFRLRLSSLEITEVTETLLAVLADHAGRICPQLHLPLQSGSDRILQGMRRRYQIGKFLRRVDMIRRRLDQPAFATDVIVGFPGETAADFAATLTAVRAVGFSRIHIFPFSARAGTPAAELTDRVPHETIRQRQEELAATAQELATAYHRQLLGRRLEMLIGTPDPEHPGQMLGLACRYATLRLATLPALRGQLAPVRAVGLDGAVINVEPWFGNEPVEPAIGEH